MNKACSSVPSRRGNLCPEKVCGLLASMAWDRRLKDMGVVQLQDMRRRKQTLELFPQVSGEGEREREREEGGRENSLNSLPFSMSQQT